MEQSKTSIFRALGRYFFGTLGNEANIVLFIKSLVVFPLTPKYMTLYGLNGHFTLNLHYFELLFTYLL